MKKQIVTFYVFAGHRWKDEVKPRLLKFEGIEITSERRHKRVKLTASSPHFGYSTIVARDQLFLSPTAALVDYRAKCFERVKRLTRELAAAANALKKCPSSPGEIHEDK